MSALEGLLDRIAALNDAHPRVLLGLAGSPGAGKSWLAELLVARLRQRNGFDAVAHVPMDGFHLANTELRRLGRSDRKGAPDTFDVAGYGALLARVLTGAPVWAPEFRRELEEPIAQSLPVGAAARVVISEGNYLLLPDAAWQQVRARFTQVWFCRADEARRRARLVARHVRYGRAPDQAERWVATSDDPNAELVRATERFADLVVDVEELFAVQTP